MLHTLPHAIVRSGSFVFDRKTVAIDPEKTRCRDVAHPIDMVRPAHGSVPIRGIHLPAFGSLPQAEGAELHSATVRPPDRFR